jgi:predicted nucleic acid-binding protein
VKFWDASALVPLLVEEASTGSLVALLRTDSEVMAWWGSVVECASAVARLERAKALGVAAASQALARLSALSASWYEIEPSDLVRETATRLLRVHDLRAGDALQLAAAHVSAEQRPGSLQLVCLDDRLARAAHREGFEVLDRQRLLG